MSKVTQSIKTGMSFIRGEEVSAYTLEFLTSTTQHPAGSSEMIIVPYVEIGRSSTCAIRFSEEDTTVSRKHVSLERIGPDVYINNLSRTNPTLVNGNPIAKQWKLTNGDEIQLSYEGPRIKYKATPIGTPAVPAKGVTQRIGIVINQAIRPYKTAAIILVAAILFGSIAATFFIYRLNKETELLADQTYELKEKNVFLSDSLNRAIEANQDIREAMLADNRQLKAELQATVANFTAKQNQLISKLNEKKASPEEIIIKAIGEVKESVFYMGIKNIQAELDGKVLVNEAVPENCHCTGFLLNDGRFITARHCVEIHLYEENELSLLASMGGVVTFSFYAISSDESTRLDFTNHDFTIDRSTDYNVEKDYNGQKVTLLKANNYDGTDWAYLRTNKKGHIQPAPDLSTSLVSGTELHCLGYTYGDTFQKPDKDQGLEVLYSRATVAKDNLENRTILVSGYGFDNGNSGGPLFIVRDEKAVVVAIVSAGYQNPVTGRDDALGSVVPINNLTN